MFMGIGMNVVRGGSVFSPAMLFAAGQTGGWYDPSDLTTLFQDSAGTTPVTAPGQPVGKILDKSGRGNHATQATAGQRPIYAIAPKTGVRNLLTYTEQFDNAVWNKVAINAFGSGSVANTTATTDPIGGTTADFIQENSAASVHGVWQAFSVSSGVSYTFSVYAKQSSGNRNLWLQTNYTPYLNLGAVFNLANGTVALGSGSVTSLGNGWYKCSVTATSSGAGSIGFQCNMASGTTTNYQGDGTSGIYLWGAQLEIGSTATAYQKVVSQYEVSEAGVPSVSCLVFDGIDDGLVTNSINFTSTNKMTVWAGVRKLSDAAAAILVELSSSTANSGSFYLGAPENISTYRYSFFSHGTATASLTMASFVTGVGVSPDTAVLTGTGDIAGSLSVIRRNGVSFPAGTVSQGTGNYGNYPLYIGRRAGSTLPFNGRLYELIVRGAASDAATISNTETWVNSKTGAY